MATITRWHISPTQIVRIPGLAGPQDALGRTRRGFAPATRQLREAESRMRGAGEGEGIAHGLVKDRRPFFRWVAPITDHPFPTRKAWRVGYHVMEIGVSVHTVVCFACRTTAETWLRRVA